MNAVSESELNIPALPPPPGVTSNFINPAQDRAAEYNAVCFFTLGLAFLFLFARLYTTIVLQKRPGWDDLSCVVALLCQATFNGLITYETKYGVGKHMWDVPARDIPLVIHFGSIITNIEEPCIFFTKLSLLLFYHRIFYPDKKTKFAILLGIVVSFLAYLIIMILFISINDLNTKLLLNRAIGVVNVVTDFYTLAIPIVAVSRLQMSRSRKIGVSAIFLTGAFACSMGVLGLVFRWTFHYSNSADLTWELIPVFIINTVERNVGIMCACIPLFPYLIKHTSTGRECTASLRRIGSYLQNSEGRSDKGSAVSTTGYSGSEPRRAQAEYHELHEMDMAGKLAIPHETHSHV